jgi:hypothetical protein
MTFACIDTSDNNGMAYSGEAAKEAGVQCWVARCTVGWGKADPAYPIAKREAEENDIPFGAYGINWPINRNPKREAQFLVKKMCPPGLARLPRFLVPDCELGTRKHAAGHEKIGGEELIVQMLTYAETLVSETALTVDFYTGHWHMTDKKVLPFLPRYAQDLRKYHVILAEYPFQGWSLLPGQTNLHPETFDPWSIRPGLAGYPNLTGLPWSELEVDGWQWSSLGRQRGICFNPPRYDVLDYSALYCIPGEAPPPPPPSLEQRVGHLEGWAGERGYTPL